MKGVKFLSLLILLILAVFGYFYGYSHNIMWLHDFSQEVGGACLALLGLVIVEERILGRG